MRVLAGVLDVEGRLFPPSEAFQPLFSPMTNSRMILTGLPPEVDHPNLQVYLEPIRQGHLHVTGRRTDCRDGLQLDLSDTDIAVSTGW